MKIRYTLVFILVVTGYLVSCSSGEEKTEEVTSESGNLVIKVDREQANIIGLEFGYLKSMLLPTRVICSGFLDTPPGNKAKISSVVSGKVVRINYLVGDRVRKGAEIIRLESVEFLEIQKNYISIRSNLTFLEDNYKRQKRLAEENVNARKVFHEAERDYFTAKAEFEYVRRKLDLLQVNTDEIEKGNISAYLSIRSTINGYVASIHTVLGEVVDADDVMAELINPDHLHAELKVYEKDVLKVKKGQKVEILTKIDTLQLLGEIFLIGKELDEESRAVMIHVHIPDNEYLLPGMYVEGNILLDEQKVIAIPEEGLLREEGRSFIYVLVEDADGNYTMKRETVIAGEEKNGMVAVQFPAAMDTSRLVAIKGVYYLASGSE